MPRPVSIPKFHYSDCNSAQATKDLLRRFDALARWGDSAWMECERRLCGLDQRRHVIVLVERLVERVENQLRSAFDQLLGGTDGLTWVTHYRDLNATEMILDRAGVFDRG